MGQPCAYEGDEKNQKCSEHNDKGNDEFYARDLEFKNMAFTSNILVEQTNSSRGQRGTSKDRSKKSKYGFY